MLIIASVTAYTLLELVSRKVLHELRENGLAKIHSSLSARLGAQEIPLNGPDPGKKVEIEKSQNHP